MQCRGDMFYIFKFPLVDEVSVIFEILKRAFVEYLSADDFFGAFCNF